MRRIDALLAELTHETATTRRHLERVPGAQFGWQPHPKSFTIGRLAMHLVDCVGWVAPVFTADELDFDATPYRPFAASTSEAVLAGFDAEVEIAKRAMAASSDADATGAWRLVMKGKVWFEKPREAAFRDLTLSHLVHHRGQLSVYLRLLDVAVPGSYGPTADDRR